jgi:hypothetical protein
MKPQIAIVAALFATAFAYGQGTVLIENVNGAKIIPIYLSDGTTQVKGADYKAALIFGGAQVGAEYPFANNGRFTSGSGVTIPGTKESGTAPGLTLQVWDTRSGGTYASAAIKGTSAAFDNPLGGGTTPPPKLVNLPSFNLSGFSGPLDGPVSGSIVPEPSTIALGIAGIAALLLQFRK